jgi:hypothetical protein
MSPEKVTAKPILPSILPTFLAPVLPLPDFLISLPVKSRVK